MSDRGPGTVPFTTANPYFPGTAHPLTPTAFWGSLGTPYPTNAHWTNAVLDSGNLPTVPLPYITTPQPNGLVVSYPQVSCSQPACFGEPMNDFMVSATGLSARHVADYDKLSFTMQWTSGAAKRAEVELSSTSSTTTKRSKAGTQDDRSRTWKLRSTDPGCVPNATFIPDLIDPDRWETTYPAFDCTGGVTPTTPTTPPTTPPTGIPPLPPAGPQPPVTFPFPTGHPPPTTPPTTPPTQPPSGVPFPPSQPQQPVTFPFPTGHPPPTPPPPTGAPPTTTQPTPVTPPPVSPVGQVAGVIYGIPANAMTIPMVYGSPYITVKYGNLQPIISSTAALLSVNGASTQGTYSGSKFIVTYNTGNRFIIYVVNSTITFTWSGNTLTASAPFTGIIRIAAAPTSTFDTLLDAHVLPYAIAASVTTTFNGDTGIYQYQFITEGSSNTGNLLMLTLPHHRDIIQGANMLSPSWSSLKGSMTPTLGTVWTLVEPLTTITWNSPTPPDPQKVPLIISAIQSDLTNFPPTPTDTYSFGKAAARYARLVLISDQLGQSSARDNFLSRLKSMVTPWLTGNAFLNSLYHDTTWGGTVSALGIRDKGAEYGQGYYNDHHFHWGYYLYAAAVIAKYDSAWAQTYNNAILDFARDIGNPSPSDHSFTTTRMKDWFCSHSWASGLFSFGDAKNQESTSEAVNGYYGLYLWGLATDNAYIRDWGRLLMAMEIRGAKKYWHMFPTDTSVYSQPFPQHTCVGMVWNTKTCYATWFGLNVEYIHGIQMLPYTPITEILLDAAWISVEYPILATALTRSDPVIQVGWLGFVYMTQAIINKEPAWNSAQTLTGYDNGNSQTNTLYWIATRPIPS